MVVQVAVAIIYELVRQSWMVAALVTKFFLLGVIAETLLRGSSRERFEENLLKYSDEYLTVVVLLAVVKGLSGLSFELFFPLFSQIVTVVYLGYLFWKY